MPSSIRSNLQSILYVSTAARLMTEPELRELLQQSQEQNARNDITGMLLYAEGSFMQVLEGERDSLRATMGRIVRDPRHTNVQVLWRQDITSREFGEWSMAFRTLDRNDHQDLEGFSSFLTADNLDTELRLHPTRSYRLLQTFKGSLSS